MKIIIDTEPKNAPEPGTQLHRFDVVTRALRDWEEDDRAPIYVREPSERLMSLVEVVGETGSVVELFVPGRWLQVAERFVASVVGLALDDDEAVTETATVVEALCELTEFLLEITLATEVLRVPGPKGPPS